MKQGGTGILHAHVSGDAPEAAGALQERHGPAPASIDLDLLGDVGGQLVPVEMQQAVFIAFQR